MMRLFAPLGDPGSVAPVSSYTDSEYRSISRLARRHVREAASRIRSGEARLARWRAGDVDRHTDRVEYKFCAGLDQLARTGDVRRTPNGAVGGKALMQSTHLHEALFLTMDESAAFVVLLQCLTGMNLSTILGLSATYSRSDSGIDGEFVSIITAASKPRRGPYSAEMNIHMAGRQRRQGEAVPRDDLTSALGVYMLAHQLCERARNFSQSDALILGYSGKKLSETENRLGFRPPRKHSVWTLLYVRNEEGRLGPPNSMRLRKTVLQRLQRPVAQSRSTLIDTYLTRDPTNLPENQALVSRAIADEVDRVSASAIATSLSEADVAEAFTAPAAVAERFGISPTTLGRVLEGQLDTVATACVDHTNSPHASAGEPCTASFLFA